MGEEIYPEILRLLTSAMRAADESFEKAGGGTRHYVRDCLWPEMRKRGLAVGVLEGGAAENVKAACDTCGGTRAVPVGCAVSRPITLPCPACSAR